MAPPLALALGMPQPAVLPERAAAEAARERLLQLGVAVDWDGSIELTLEAARRYTATPWAKDFAADSVTRALPRQRDLAPSCVQMGSFDRFLSRVCRALEAAAAATAWQEMDEVGRANLLSGGGAGTGTLWTRVARSPTEMLANAHWRQATASRLDVRPVWGWQRCQLRRADDPEGQHCGALLCSQPRHSEVCKRGAVRQRAHRNLAGAVQAAAANLGMHTDLERFIPELYARLGPEVPDDALAEPAAEQAQPQEPDADGGDSRPALRIKRAIMDVVLQCPGFESLLLIDVSIRSAAAGRYSSASCAGHTAASGERDKRKRYGDAVLPLVFECGGRLGPASQDTLCSIVSQAAAARLCSSHSITSWRSRCERSVLFSVADAAIRACVPAKS